ncbi:MAG: transposase [Actinomycetota bacterium]|nr:transposase [Actinomycetota bacterium]
MRTTTRKPTKKRPRSHRKKPRGRTANRYRAYPTPEQAVLIRRFGGSCRFVKNLGKEQRDLAWRYGRHSVSYTAQSKEILALRSDPELGTWLREVPAQILQQALVDVNRAYQSFFDGHGGYPRWARYSGWCSFRDPQDVKLRVKSQRWAEVKIQGLGWMKVRYHRPIRGAAIKSATVVMEPDGKVFVSILTELHRRQPTNPLVEEWASALGVDRGVTVAVAAKDGLGNADLIDREMWSHGERKRLRRLEQARERKKSAREKATTEVVKEDKQREPRGETPREAPLGTLAKSKNQEGTERQIAALHARARRRRKDFTEQVSTTLARDHRLSVFEDLHTKSMTASAKGSVEAPGKNVRQKAALNRAVLDKAWYAIEHRTADKQARHGHLHVVVAAPGTSITCPVATCGHVDNKSRVSQSMFVCTNCGYQAHADLNAAEVIRKRGIELAFAGGTPVAAHQGTNLGPRTSKDMCGAEPSELSGRGSGNEETGTSAVEGAA